MRSRQNGGVIGVPNSPTVTSSPGVWSISEINTLESAPNKPAIAAVRYTNPTTWPNTGNISANVDPYAAQKVFHIPDMDYTDWAQKDQSDNAWHEFAAMDTNYRGGKAVAFGPAYSDWSTHFHEDAYYIVVDTTALQFASNPFTIEFWAKLQRQDATLHWVMGRNNVAGIAAGTGWGVYVSATYQIGFFDAVANTTISSTTTLDRDQWYHIAMTRANTSASGFSIWINGTRDTTSTVASNFSSSGNLLIGRDGQATAATYYGGRLSDIRISNAAMYTTSFTAPTSNLAMPGNTTLFGHSSTNPGHGTMANSQPQSRRVGVAGSAQRFIDSPYIDNSTIPNGPGYNSVYGYSTYGGWKIYDTHPTNTSLRLGTGPFTVEAWIYLSSTGSTGTASGIAGKGTLNVNTASGTGWNFYTSGSTLVWNDGATTLLSSVASPNITIAKGGWHHVAAVRSGTGTNQFAMYIDGSLVYVGTLASDYNQTDPLRLLNTRNGDYYFRGFIAGLKISNVAVYTSSFDATPATLIPTSTKSFSANTVLLIGAQTNNDIVRSWKQDWIDRGTLRMPLTFRSTEPKIGAHHYAPSGNAGKEQISMYFTGTTSDSLAAYTTTSDWDFGTGDFSIEFWFMPRNYNTVSTYQFILDTRRYFNDNGIAIRYGTNINQIEVYSGNQILLTNNKIIADNRNWSHYVVQRKSGAIALYANGFKVCETLYTGSIVSTDSRMIIGNSVYPNIQPGNALVGYISDLRIIKGGAPYAVNGLNPDSIIVPTEPVPVTPETVLSVFNSPILRDLSSRNNYIHWNAAQYSTGNWDFYICNQSPYRSLPINRDTSVVSDTWSSTSGYSLADGFYFSGSSHPEFAFIARFSKPWTIEGFFYWHQTNPSAPTTTVDYVATASSSGHDGFNLRLGYGNGAASYNNVSFAVYTSFNSGVQYLYTSYTPTNTVLKGHSWNHVAVQFDPSKTNKMAIFINGVRAVTGPALTASQKVWHTNNISTGNAGLGTIRISTIARYDNDSATYTIPAQNFVYDQYTYHHVDLGRTCVWSEYARKLGFFVYGNPVPSLNFKKFGTGSLKFSNKDSSALIERIQAGGGNWNARPLDLDKQDWTFECWASWHDLAYGGVNFSASGNSFFNYSDAIFIKISSTGYWQLIRGGTVTVYQTLTTDAQVATRSAGTWDHVCLVRRGGSYYFYINGVEKGNIFGNGTGTYANLSVGPTTDINDNYSSASAAMYFGTDAQSTVNTWNGYMQDLRWTYLARYTTKVINGVPTMVHVNTLLPALPTAIHPR